VRLSVDKNKRPAHSPLCVRPGRVSSLPHDGGSVLSAAGPDGPTEERIWLHSTLVQPQAAIIGHGWQSPAKHCSPEQC
jgi:hypothetical protein